MGVRVASIIALGAIIAIGATAEPLNKDILNLPSLIHFTDLFNKDHEKINKFLGTWNHANWLTLQWPSYPQKWSSKPSYPVYPTNPGYPTYPGHPTYPGYPSYPGVPPIIGYPPKPIKPIYPYPVQQQTIYPSYPSYPHYDKNPQYLPYLQYPSSRQFDTEVLDRYYKYNEDGSKEYKFILSNGLIIYQKIMNSDNQNFQVMEGYYSDTRDDNTYLITHFRADENGYSTSSETRDSPPSYPDIKAMVHLPLPAYTTKLQE